MNSSSSGVTVQNGLLPSVQNQSISLSSNYSSSKKAAIFILGLVTAVAVPILFAYASLYKSALIACSAGVALIMYSFTVCRSNDLKSGKVEYEFARTLNKEGAKSWLEKSAEKKYPPAMRDYGIFYQNDKMLRQAAYAGDFKAGVYLEELEIFKENLMLFRYQFEFSIVAITSASFDPILVKLSAENTAKKFVERVDEILIGFLNSEFHSALKERLKENLQEIIQQYLDIEFLKESSFLDLVIRKAKENVSQTSVETLEILTHLT
jgi:hypothetical protein